jgi:two-component system invasion response regulator UvrY
MLSRRIPSQNLPPIHTRLSERELQVFGRLALGMTVSAIARELELSIKTVSTYRSRVLAKMLLTTNAEIIFYAFRNGIVQ